MGEETRMLDSMSDEELEEELQRIERDKKRSRNSAGSAGSASSGRRAAAAPETNDRYTEDDIDIVDDIKAWEAGGVLPEDDTVPDLGSEIRRFSYDDEDGSELGGADDLDLEELGSDTRMTQTLGAADGEEGEETRLLNSMSDEELEEELEAIEKKERKAARKNRKAASKQTEDWEVRDDRAEWEKKNNNT